MGAAPHSDMHRFAQFARSRIAPVVRSRKAAASMVGGGLVMATTSETFAADQKPDVLFVLGPPGAGKGTNCEKLVQHYGYFHISAGDCLREERNNPNSKDGELINKYIKEGAIVPVEITIKLMLKKMHQQQALGTQKFLVDGFPRN